ncbi:hypothetical protein [Noviherbaspirillum sp.]|uniref:hypothetical protein n=1 Tax=Noviherbaspirillum sp. TaxID=1926288 RepID=UPI002D3AB74E|nr:hypothetical protein [Noviherbaspirillum sp.]HZW23780.1 hypothetical protein [Noviherbaspirillum sp.]
MAKASSKQTAAKSPAKTAPAPAAKPATKAAAGKTAPATKPDAAVKAIAAKAPKAAEKPVVKPVAEPKEKPKKPKLVRDSFTMPEAEYAVLGEVKKACLKAGIEVKKSELLRVGVALIRQLDTARLKEILAGLPALKAGRPKKSK